MSSNRFKSIIAASQLYFQTSGIKTPFLAPIPITCKKTGGWSFSQSKPSKGLADAVQSIVGKSVLIQEFDANDAPNVDGMLVEQADKAIIFVNKGLNFCWRRFFVAKELTHLLMNHGDSDCRAGSSDDVKEVIQNFFTKNLFGSNAQHKNTEHEAMFIAVELLFPNQLRQLTYTEMLLPREIAQKVKVPEIVIASRFYPNIDDYFEREIYSASWYESAIISERVSRAH
ncbi:MAG: ImmA/IrrE family metallo-endopeptidase [Methylobacter sp.]|uniref:ImmA/IrrE family metallo-endopeptidase n=1 Tax=Methylobacter sp. TaxID=2051955 RepID=UPI0025E443F6|nr:ImmA/IrrE family metallo-endopeptidase [Methylobacter sp.]MCK9622759.1 ImmA/IrrE family metallo-endopeptidase [Methylobacter sp.]